MLTFWTLDLFLGFYSFPLYCTLLVQPSPVCLLWLYCGLLVCFQFPGDQHMLLIWPLSGNSWGGCVGATHAPITILGLPALSNNDYRLQEGEIRSPSEKLSGDVSCAGWEAAIWLKIIILYFWLLCSLSPNMFVKLFPDSISKYPPSLLICIMPLLVLMNTFSWRILGSGWSCCWKGTDVWYTCCLLYGMDWGSQFDLRYIEGSVFNICLNLL